MTPAHHFQDTRHRVNQQGFTLLELMFAAGVLATALAIMFTALISISLISRLNDSHMDAAASMATVMEEVRTFSHNDLMEYLPPDIPGPGVEHVVEVEAVLGENEQTGELETVALPLPEEFDGTLPNPLEFRVTLTWEEENGRIFEMVGSTVRGR